MSDFLLKVWQISGRAPASTSERRTRYFMSSLYPGQYIGIPYRRIYPISRPGPQLIGDFHETKTRSRSGALAYALPNPSAFFFNFHAHLDGIMRKGGGFFQTSGMTGRSPPRMWNVELFRGCDLKDVVCLARQLHLFHCWRRIVFI